MNRHARRAAAKRDVAPRVVVCLDLHCAGPFSSPPQACDRRLLVPMPFDAETLRVLARTQGWWMTGTSPMGEPPTVTVLCESCAKAVLPPELLEAAQRHSPGVS